MDTFVGVGVGADEPTHLRLGGMGRSSKQAQGFLKKQKKKQEKAKADLREQQRVERSPGKHAKES